MKCKDKDRKTHTHTHNTYSWSDDDVVVQLRHSERTAVRTAELHGNNTSHYITLHHITSQTHSLVQ